MKTMKMAVIAVLLTFGVSSCMQNTEDVKVDENKIEAPADETSVDESEIPTDEEMEDNMMKQQEMDSDEDPIMDTMQK